MDNLKALLAGLNLNEEQAALDDLKQQSAELTAAIERGHARMLQIAREVEALKAGRGDGEAAAEALLGGDNVALASPQLAALQDEREAIKGGLSTLADRDIEIGRTRREVIDRVSAKSGAAFESHVTELEQRAQTIAGELAGIYADADAIGHTAGNVKAVRLAASLREGLQGFRHVDKLVATEAPVSPSLIEALEANPARQMLRRHVPHTVRII